MFFTPRKNTHIFSKTLFFIMAFFIVQNPAHAQFSDSFEFLKAVEKRDGEKATKFIDEGLINTKETSSGRTALHIVVDRRDVRWLTFLLQKKARPNVKDKKGLSPLMRSVELNFIEGIEKFITYKANVDYTNRSGETPLIRAVQLGYVEAARLLIEAGANPDKRDVVAGLSAREYAARDRRAVRILALIEANDEKKKKAVEKDGKGLDFTGVTGPVLE